MFYLQQTIPDTMEYMIAGYAVIFSILFLYTISILYRYRQAKDKISLYQDQIEE